MHDLVMHYMINFCCIGNLRYLKFKDIKLFSQYEVAFLILNFC